MILNGNEMIMGDSIIIPIDIKTLATTMSIIKKGIKIRKPIWKAVFNSLVKNEGTKIDKGKALKDAKN